MTTREATFVFKSYKRRTDTQKKIPGIEKLELKVGILP